MRVRIALQQHIDGSVDIPIAVMQSNHTLILVLACDVNQLFHFLLKVSIVVVRNHLCKSNLFCSSLRPLLVLRLALCLCLLPAAPGSGSAHRCHHLQYIQITVFTRFNSAAAARYASPRLRPGPLGRAGPSGAGGGAQSRPRGTGGSWAAGSGGSDLAALSGPARPRRCRR